MVERDGLARAGARWAKTVVRPGLAEMFYVYVLKSERDGRLYTGMTRNLSRRLAEHRQGKVKSTVRRRPLTLVYSEEFPDKTSAASRERYFKTPEGGALKQRLVESNQTRLID